MKKDSKLEKIKHGVLACGRRVLVISAHADDSSVCAGGLIAHLSFGGVEVHDLTLSGVHGVFPGSKEGEYVHYSSAIEQEHGLAMERLGVISHSLLDFHACTGDFQHGAATGRLRFVLEEVRDRIHPDTVITHHPLDTHQDHATVAQEVIRSFKYSASILFFWFPYNVIGAGSPDCLMQINVDDLKIKIEAAKCYKTQQGAGRSYLQEEVIRSQAVFIGSLVRKPLAEAYCAHRLLLFPW